MVEKNVSVRNTVIRSMIWKFLERAGTQGVQFIVQIILARFLAPGDYGTIGLVIVFINIATVLVQSGFSTALIQKKDTQEQDFNAVFFVNVASSVVMYFILYIASPALAKFYENAELVLIFRVLALTLLFGGINAVQNALLIRKMQFRKIFFASFIAAVLSGIIGVTMAYNGCGVWALVSQQISNQLFMCIVFGTVTKWYPKFQFAKNGLKELFSFGWKMLISSLIENLYTNLSSLVIGKVYTSALLGYYNRGKQFPAVIATNINGTIQAVMLPTLSEYQDDKVRVKEIMRRSIRVSAYGLFPCMIGLACIAEPLVLVLLTEKWIGCVPYLQIFCIMFALYPIHTANLQAITAIGRSDIFLKLEITKKCIGILILCITIPRGVMAMAIGELLNGFISTFVNAYPNKKLLGYSYLQQVKDIIPSVALSFIMGGIIWLIKFLPLRSELLIVVQILIGILVYITCSALSRNKNYQYLVAVGKGIFNKKAMKNKD